MLSSQFQTALAKINSKFRSNTVIPKLTETLNALTGYDKVEQLKLQVNLKDKQLKENKTAALICKSKYEETIENRRRCQNQINGLLQVLKNPYKDANYLVEKRYMERCRYICIYTIIQERSSIGS